MKIALAQVNPTVGDLDGNAKLITEWVAKAKAAKADLVVFPEMVLSGYPVQDLVYSKPFLKRNKELAHELAKHCAGIACVFGFVDTDAEGRRYNAAAVVADGKLLGVQHKMLLPTYDVFDEDRHFAPAKEQAIYTIAGHKLGIHICEDMWDDTYERKPCAELVEKGAEMLINLSASPFYAGKRFVREELVRRHATTHGVPFVYCNLIGGQDDLVFDGRSFAMDWEGRLIAKAKSFEEELVTFDIDLKKRKAKPIEPPASDREEEIFKALVLGVRDYFRKCGVKGPGIIGVSGGIDSALVAAIAKFALGPERVIGVSMPSKVSSQHSKDDAKVLAENLGIKYITMAIQESVDVAGKRFKAVFGAYKQGVTIENLQARERGKILMEIANDTGGLVLSTGNKTEMALGYCTLYGDMCGGLSVISDLGKHEVYALSRWINARHGGIIPKNSIDKIPSAELAEGQFDPFDYPVIGPMVNEMVENHRTKEELIMMGYLAKDVDRCFRLLRINEFKRRQAAPGIKITTHAFGTGWKMPIVNKWEG
jgi:NAD+ synthetase